MTEKTDRGDAPRFARARDLAADGWTPKRLARAVAEGRFLRLRKGVYAEPGLPEACIAAVRVGGRLCGSSELQRRGVFVLDNTATHVHIEPTSSRLPPVPEGTAVQRGILLRTPHPRSCSVEVFDAVVSDIVMPKLDGGELALFLSFLENGLVERSTIATSSRCTAFCSALLNCTRRSSWWRAASADSARSVKRPANMPEISAAKLKPNSGA